MSHDHHDHAHHHSHALQHAMEHRSAPLRRLYISLAITLVGMIAEIVGGVISGSLALMSDAGHMFTHLFALGMSALALHLARRTPTPKATFGYHRAEVLAAYTNALLLAGVAIAIIYEAAVRIAHPQQIRFAEMMVVATVGLVVNVASIALLHRHGSNISVRSAVAHMLADTISSVAIIAGALVIRWTSWFWIDAVLSVAIAAVIVRWGWGLFRQTSGILMEMAPSTLDAHVLEHCLLEADPELVAVHDAHVWSVTEDRLACQASMEFRPTCDASSLPGRCLGLATRLKRQNPHLRHVSLAPHTPG